MASERRIQLTALSDQTLPPPVLNSNAAQNPTKKLNLFAPLEPSETDAVASVRMELVLFEPNDLGCAEFYYPELLDMKKVTGNSRVDTFGDVAKEENEEMEYMAKMFEEKYGRASKKRKDRPQDLVDIGDGYDDSDSFIDNSEAYDELVPACLTTKHGGFYINFGALQFRPALGDSAGNETDDFEDKVKPKKRKLQDDEKLKKVNKKKKIKKEEQSDINHVKKSKSQSIKTTVDVDSMLKEFHKEKLAQLQLFNLNEQQAVDCGITSQLEESGSDDPLDNTAAGENHLRSIEHECDVEDILTDHMETRSPEVLNVNQQIKPPSPPSDALSNGLIQHVQQLTQDDQMKQLIQRLDAAVSRVMPEQMDRFKYHCQTHSEAIALRREAEKEQALFDGSDNEKWEKIGKRVCGPRKWFRWTEDIKEMLCDVVQLKMSSFEFEAPDKQNLEDYLKIFLETHVKPLWPRGWMQSRILLLESRKVHRHITGITAKKKSLTSASKKAVTEGSCGDPALPTPSLSLQASASDFNIKLQVVTDMTPLHASTFLKQPESGKNFKSFTAAAFQECL